MKLLHILIGLINYMQGTKPEIIFTFPIALGGVSSFNFNLINNSKLLNNFYTKVILLKTKNETRPAFTEKFNVDEQLIFEYDDFENQYHVQKRFSKLLGTREGAIVTDNGFTMETARRFKIQKTIFSLIHDYYYVNQQIQLGSLADVAIAHASFFSDAVFSSNPILWAGRTFYIPYGVKQLEQFPNKKNDMLNVVFLGRLEESKGVLKLINIQKQLLSNKIKVRWTIIGKGSLKSELINQWKDYEVDFFEPSTTNEVYNILIKQDIFIFPTIFEGTPVAILEAMACGVVTIVNDLPGGIRDIVTVQTGFRCLQNNTETYVENIITLNNDREKLKEMQQNCFLISKSNYDVAVNSDNYVNLFLEYKKYARTSIINVRRLQKLDKSIVPNLVTKAIRKIKNKL
jgi:glycosyltransferase involved in cell wall biosynthesis